MSKAFQEISGLLIWFISLSIYSVIFSYIISIPIDIWTIDLIYFIEIHFIIFRIVISIPRAIRTIDVIKFGCVNNQQFSDILLTFYGVSGLLIYFILKFWRNFLLWIFSVSFAIPITYTWVYVDDIYIYIYIYISFYIYLIAWMLICDQPYTVIIYVYIYSHPQINLLRSIRTHQCS